MLGRARDKGWNYLKHYWGSNFSIEIARISTGRGEGGREISSPRIIVGKLNPSTRRTGGWKRIPDAFKQRSPPPSTPPPPTPHNATVPAVQRHKSRCQTWANWMKLERSGVGCHCFEEIQYLSFTQSGRPSRNVSSRGWHGRRGCSGGDDEERGMKLSTSTSTRKLLPPGFITDDPSKFYEGSEQQDQRAEARMHFWVFHLPSAAPLSAATLVFHSSWFCRKAVDGNILVIRGGFLSVLYYFGGMIEVGGELILFNRENGKQIVQMIRWPGLSLNLAGGIWGTGVKNVEPLSKI